VDSYPQTLAFKLLGITTVKSIPGITFSPFSQGGKGESPGPLLQEAVLP